MIKIFGKIFAYTLLLIAVLIIGFCAMNYKADIPYEKLKAKYSYPESEHVEIMSMPVHYRIIGEGPNLVLLHGTSSSLHTWEDLVEGLKEDYRTITLDLPAFGLTGPNPDNKYDIAFYNAFLDQFLDKLGIEKCFLAGNSFGGRLTWEYAIHNEERVERLVLLNSSGYPVLPENGLPIGFKLAKNPMIAPVLESITPESIVKSTASDAYEIKAALTNEKLNRYFDFLLREGNRKALNGKMLSILPDRSEYIKTVQQPTLIIWGDKDKLVPVECANKFKQDIAGSELVIYKNIGHLPMEEIPGRVIADFKKFLVPFQVTENLVKPILE